MNVRSGPLSHEQVLKRLKGPVFDGKDVLGRHAGVAILLSPSPLGFTELLLIRRSERATDPWSGQVGLPGGLRQDEDASLLATARRETLEEVGLDLATAPCIRSLPTLSARNRGTSRELDIHPFVFAVRDPYELVLQTIEVRDARRFPLCDLFDRERASTLTKVAPNGSRDLPAIALAPDWLLWGLTYGILASLADLLDQSLASGPPL
jgi:8-oxo-dGTP pyrophosphatase MutT (NUDIX family)